MTKEDKQQLGQEAESVLDFKDAKEMTIGQANRKAEEIEAGVKETDNVLDKYIKQHRDEIEAHKFDTIVMQKEMLAEAEEAVTVEATESIPNEEPAYLFYDPEHETNLKYLYKMMLEKDQYHVKRLNFDDLNEVAEKIYEK